MFNSTASSSPDYHPLRSRDDSDTDLSATETLLEKNITTYNSSPRYTLVAIILITLLCVFNVALLPSTLSAYHLSDSQIDALPYGDLNIGLDRADTFFEANRDKGSNIAWPAAIARLNQKLDTAVYGDGKEVFISVEDATLFRFSMPKGALGVACSFQWTGPPALGPRKQDLEIKGNVNEIEVWSIVAPNAKLFPPGAKTTFSDIDFNTVSWATKPVSGELLGVLDLSKPNSTTVEFKCPGPMAPHMGGLKGKKEMVVMMKCGRIACKVKYLQVKEMLPKMGFELVHRN